MYFSPNKTIFEKSLLSQNKFQGRICKPLELSKGLHFFPNFYDGLQQRSIFFLFSITQFSCLPRRYNMWIHIKKLFRSICKLKNLIMLSIVIVYLIS